MILDCPQGFVIPDDPTSSGNLYINHTLSQCALSCVNPPFFTNSESVMFNSTEMYSSIAGALLAFVVAILWYQNDVKRKRFFAVTYGVLILCTLVFLAISSSFGRARYCRNNANPVDGQDGGVRLCTIEAAMLIFAILSCAAFFCMQSFEVFRKLVLGSKAPFRPWLHGLIVVGLPLVCSIAGIGLRIYGSNIGTPVCADVHHGMGAVAITVLPFTFLTGAGLIFSISITIKTLWLVAEGHSVWDTLRLVSTPLYFIVFTGLYLVALFSLRFFFLTDASVLARQQVMLDWGACALAHFDGTTESYVASCGAHPDRKLSITVWCLSAFSIRGGFGFCFFMVNIHGVISELGKYFCPSHVQPAPYFELAPMSLNSSAAADGAGHHVDVAAMMKRDMMAPRLDMLSRRFDSVSGGSNDSGISVMARLNAENDEFVVMDPSRLYVLNQLSSERQSTLHSNLQSTPQSRPHSDKLSDVENVL